MKLKMLHVSEIDIFERDIDDVVAILRTRCKYDATTYIVTLNPEIFEAARKNESYVGFLKSADIITADGVGICAAYWCQKKEKRPRLTGVRMVEELLKLSTETYLPIVVVGCSEDTRREFEKLAKGEGAIVHPGMSPDFSINMAEADSVIKALPFKAIFIVALGFPKQDSMIDALLRSGRRGVFIGVGGALDILVIKDSIGERKSEELGFHWLYRLIRDPRGRFKRQIMTLPPFAVREIVWPWIKGRVGELH